MNNRSALFFGFLLAACSVAVQAEDNRDNVVNFQVEVSRPLANDTLSATLFVEESDAVPSRLAERVNSVMNGVLTIARNYKTVKVETGSVQTWPIYTDKNKLTAWRTRAEVNLQSKDFANAQKLIAELQNRLQIENIAFSVSPELRRQQENELMGEAFAAFRERAHFVQLGLNGKAWKVINIHVSNNAYQPPRPMMDMAMRSKTAMAESVTAPELAAGESELRMQVSGSIQVDR